MPGGKTHSANLRNVALRGVLLILLAVWWTAMLAGTHAPRPIQPPIGFPQSDKFLHFTSYLGLGALLCVVLRQFMPVRSAATIGRAAGRSLAIAALYGAIDELTQPLMGRDAEWLDFLADVGGACCGVALATILCYALTWKSSQGNKPGSGTDADDANPSGQGRSQARVG